MRPTGSVPLATLCLTFLRLGLTAFGGPAMVPYVRKVAVEKNTWLTPKEFQDGVALCQSIPGATVMQLVAYIGLKVHGPLGSLVSFIAFGLPAFVLMLILTIVYARTRNAQAVLSVFAGLQVIVVALVANAAYDFGRKTVKDWRDGLLALGAALFILAGGNPILAICAASLAGLAAYGSLQTPASNPPDPVTQGTGAPGWGAWTLLGLFCAGLAALYLADRRLFDLAALMAKVDLFAMGGGFASVPLMFHEMVELRGWFDGRTFMDGIALGQVTPGPIVITATFAGYLLRGFTGAVIGTVAVFSPSLILLWGVFPHFERLRHSAVFQRVLRGSLASFVGLLMAVALRFALAASWDLPSLALAAAALIALVLKVDVLWVVVAGAALSLAML